MKTDKKQSKIAVKDLKVRKSVTGGTGGTHQSGGGTHQSGGGTNQSGSQITTILT